MPNTKPRNRGKTRTNCDAKEAKSIATNYLKIYSTITVSTIKRKKGVRCMDNIKKSKLPRHIA